jgi:hypothetical protein
VNGTNGSNGTNGTKTRGSVAFRSPVSRRVFLRGAAGGVLALPLFNDLVAPEARAQGMTAPFPKRLLILFSPNGTIQNNFFGSGEGSSFTLGPIMSPLETHKKDLVVLDNIDMKAAGASPGDAHGVGMGCMLTGKKLQSGSQFVAGMGGPGSGWPDNISIDQLIAQTVGKSTALGSLELAGKRFAGNLWSRMSYTGPAAPVSPQEDPQRAFDTVFASVGQISAATMRLNARRKSVLDSTIAEFNALSAKLGTDDQKKLTEHADRLRDLEMRLANMQTSTGPASCKVPPRPTVMASPEVIANNSGMEKINAVNDKTFPDIIKAQIDTIVGAFSCDVTRVATLLMAPSRSDVVLSWLKYNNANMTESHHEISHFVLSTNQNNCTEKLTIINQWYSQQVADLITKLKAIPEGTGTLFDSTLVVWVNELGIGDSHSHTRIPLAFAGATQGYFKTGRYVKFPNGTSMNNLLVSIANAMGVMPTAKDSSGKTLNNIFGDPAFCTGPLSGLTA